MNKELREQALSYVSYKKTKVTGQICLFGSLIAFHTFYIKFHLDLILSYRLSLKSPWLGWNTSPVVKSPALSCECITMDWRFSSCFTRNSWCCRSTNWMCSSQTLLWHETTSFEGTHKCLTFFGIWFRRLWFVTPLLLVLSEFTFVSMLRLYTTDNIWSHWSLTTRFLKLNI